MAKENKYGRIIRYIKGIGLMIELMVEVDSFMPMGMSMKVNGRMIKHMAKEFTLKMMVPVILGSGLRIYSMVLVSKDGLTAPPTKGICFFT